MLDFGLYCDITEYIDGYRKQLAETLARSCKAVSKNSFDNNEEALIALINCCDKKTLDSLINYFDVDHPIQKLLEKRNQELYGTTYLEEGLNEQVKKGRKASFYLYLHDLILKKNFKDDSEFYIYINMSRQTFSKIRITDFISRNHALLMAAGLGLNYVEAAEFLAKAGYSFRESVTREMIMVYIMKNKKYDLAFMDETLMDLGETPLMGGA